VSTRGGTRRLLSPSQDAAGGAITPEHIVALDDTFKAAEALDSRAPYLDKAAEALDILDALSSRPTEARDT
jgi:hypothetical protein